MLAILLGVLITFAMGFQCGGPPTPPPVGFQVHTLDEADLFGTLEDSPNVNLSGTLQEAIVDNPVGTFKYFSGTTDSSGYVQALNVVVPANWWFTEYTGPCAGQSTGRHRWESTNARPGLHRIVLGFHSCPQHAVRVNSPINSVPNRQRYFDHIRHAPCADL